MKKQTPMQMKKKEVKSDPKKQDSHKSQRPKSAMERYAQERNAQLKMSTVQGVTMHDPQTDLHHLQSAAMVQADKNRHRAAKMEAKKKIKALTNVLK